MRLAPLQVTSNTVRLLPLEGLRGLAALAVFYAHITTVPLDPTWSPPAFLQRLEFGQAAVLIFFILSGYVIGLTNQQSPTIALARAYVHRRFWRLAPINTLAVILTLLVAGFGSAQATFGNFALLENDLGYFGVVVPTLPANPNLWSLNYELICYATFLVSWFCRPRIVLLFGVIGAVALFSWSVPTGLRFLPAYATGLAFWFAGLALAWRVPSQTSTSHQVPLAAAALLALVTWKMQFLSTGVHRLGHLTPRGSWIFADYLDFLPVALWLVALICQRENRFIRTLPWLVIAWLAFNFGWRAFRGTYGLNPMDQVYFALFLLAIPLLAWRTETLWLGRFAPFGAISFAFYVFAAPLQHLTSTLCPALSGSMFTFGLRLTFCFALTVTLAWLAEHRFQPWVRNQIRSRPTLVPAS